MARRQSIDIEGYKHRNPIPAASRVGNVLMTGVVQGLDSETGTVPETLEGQCEVVFRHIRAIVEKAGGTPDDIVKISFWLRDPDQRPKLNAEWVKMFPDPGSRPARHTAPGTPNEPYLVSCEFTAVLDDGA